MADSARPQPKQTKRWFNPTTPPHIITLVLIAGLGALNMNIFLPALPSMAEFFDAEYAVVQLAISAYLLVTALLQLVIGPLSDLIGRRQVMLGSLVIFLLATVACILSTDIVVFLFFRMIQATTAAGIVLSRAVVRDMVSADEAASMIGYVTMGMAVVPMVGPAIGGLLDAAYGWQASFIFTLAFGLVVTLVVWRDMGETNTHKSASFSAQFKTYPELLSSRRFWGYAMVAAFASGSFFAFLGGGPWVATQVLGMTSAELGIYFGLIAFGYMIGNLLSGLFAKQVGVNRMMVIGGMVSILGLSVGIALFLMGYQTPLVLFGSILFVGIGNGLTMPSANSGMVSVRPHLAGSASGLGGALMIGGGAALSAITGALLGPGTGAYPLLVMMLLSAICCLLMAFYVIFRSHQVARETGAGRAR